MRLGLVVVARADVEDVAVERRAQELGAGERPDERHARFGEDRQRRRARRRADVGEEQEHAILLDQLLGVLGGKLRLVLVVERLHLDPPAVDAALRIHVVQVELRAVAHLDAELGRRSRERGRLPDQDRGRRDAVLRLRSGDHRARGECRRGAHQKVLHRRFPPKPVAGVARPGLPLLVRNRISASCGPRQTAGIRPWRPAFPASTLRSVSPEA